MTGARRWLPDVLLGLVAAGLGLGSTLLGWAPARPLGAALAAIAGLALAGARRWPWPVLLAECVLLVLTDALSPAATDLPQLAVAVALGLAAYTAGWPATALAFLLAFAATMINVIDPGNRGVLAGGQGLLRLVGLVAFAAAPIAFGRYLRGVRDAARVAEERGREAEERRAVETRAARLAERTSIARDLHDIVAHHVGAIALQAGAAQFATRHTGRVDDAVQAFGELRGTASRVLDELRELLEVLRDPEALDSTAWLVEPEQIITDAERRVRAAGLSVRVSLADTVAAAPLVVRTTAARVIQEGLTNTLKHAGPGASVSVEVRPDHGELVVEILDTGPERPRPSLPPSGHGLIGMRERVRLLGGALTAGPASGGGWRLRACLPIKENM